MEKSEPAHFESLYPDTSRSDEIEKILKYVKEGKSVQLVGLPGVGRSNLLGFLSYNRNIREKHLGENQKWFHFVPADFSEIRNKSLTEALKFLSISLIESLRERKMDEEFGKVNEILSSDLLSGDDLMLFQGLKRAVDFLSVEKELTVVFLLDRFEEYIPTLTSEFFSGLKTLRNRAKYRFSVVFSLPRPLEELVETSLFADFYEFVADNIVYIPLVDNSGLEFRISYLEKIRGEKFKKETVEEVIALTGGHGKMVRLCLESLKNGDAKDLENYLLSQKSVQGSLFEIWKSLTPAEQENILNKSEYSQYLLASGLIQNDKLSIPLLGTYISGLKPETKKINLNKSTNEITLGNILISDTLTSSEHKLLTFLIENEGKMIERDEIINAVWKESGTALGVSDQAIDQLIYRMRKKIETNPENPQHIQTLKGKGIRFVS